MGQYQKDKVWIFEMGLIITVTMFKFLLSNWLHWGSFKGVKDHKEVSCIICKESMLQNIIKICSSIMTSEKVKGTLSLNFNEEDL